MDNTINGTINDTINIFALPSHDATRRLKSRFSAGVVPQRPAQSAQTVQGELWPELAYTAKPENDPVNHPAHYTNHPSGIECIQITEHMGFCLGNAIKYIWRAELKGRDIEDLKKAVWYVQREIERREAK